MRRWLLGAVGLALVCAAAPAQTSSWRPVERPTPPAPPVPLVDAPDEPVPEPAGASPVALPSAALPTTPPPAAPPTKAPAATLGMPTALPEAPAPGPLPPEVIVPVTFGEEQEPPGRPADAAPTSPPAPPPFAPPDEDRPAAPAGNWAPQPDPPPTGSAPAGDSSGDVALAPPKPAGKRTSKKSRSDDDSPFRRSLYTDILGFSWGGGEAPGQRAKFQSDPCFDYFISPVTNPFLFEDPRSLTELRPMFLLQTIPNSNPIFKGGNIEYFGLQARLAVTDRLSFTMNKLGGLAINPGKDALIDSSAGFAEIWLGPKFTFLRNEETRTLGAAGMIFQIPAGRGSVFQDTGDLSLVPYVSFAQNWPAGKLLGFNFMNTTGYSFGTDKLRSDYFYTSFHADMYFTDQPRLYPLMELHWFHYTQSGSQRNLAQEGRDLANLGSTGVGGRDYLALAAGIRFKFTECAQIGVAAEVPLNGSKDLFDFRLTVDFIWRY